MGFFEAFAKSKIPSLLLLLLMFGAGGWLIKGEANWSSVSSISGIVILIATTVLAIYAASDFRKREEFDSIAKHYESALVAIAGTHSKFEEKAKETLTNQNLEMEGYKKEEDQTTVVE